MIGDGGRTALLSRRSFLRRAGSVPVAALTALAIPRAAAAATVTTSITVDDGSLRFMSRPDLAPAVLRVRNNAVLPDGQFLFLTDGGLTIFDGHGELVWCRDFGNSRRFASDFRVQRYRGKDVLTWFEGVNEGTHSVGEFVVMSNAYEELLRFPAHGGGGDGHEFLITPEDHALITVYRSIPADLSRLGGSVSGQVFDGVVQEIDLTTGTLVFEWRASEHVPLEASFFPVPKSPTPFDFFHINGVSLDSDGSLLVSARHTWAVYKVARPSGSVLWTLGGSRSDFTMSSAARFAWQHSAQRLPNGDIALFDNQASPAVASQSRGLLLTIDESRMYADVAAEFRSPGEPRLSGSQGNIQPLAKGRFLVGWGALPVVTCFNADGTVEFEATLDRGQSYRVFASGWRAAPLDRPALIVLPIARRASRVITSWNGATDVASWRVYAGATPSQMRPVADIPNAGFESSVEAPLDAPFWFVAALGSDGSLLGVSRTVRRGT